MQKSSSATQFSSGGLRATVQNRAGSTGDCVGPFDAAYCNSVDRGRTDGYDTDIKRSSRHPPIQDGDALGWDPNFTRDVDDDPDTAFGGTNVLHHIGSAHTSGIKAVFADGSVSGFSYDIDPVEFDALGTRSGEETATEEDR